MNLDPTSCFYLSRSLAGGGAAFHEKLVIIGDGAVFSLSRVDQPLQEGVSWALTKCRMLHLIVDLVGPFAEKFVEVPKGPDRLPLGINVFGHLARAFGRLGIAQQGVHEFRVGGAKEPLNHRTEPWFGSRSRFLATGVTSDQRFKILAVKLLPSVHNEGVGKAPEAFHTNAQRHHAGTIAGGIESQVDGQQATRKRIKQ